MIVEDSSVGSGEVEQWCWLWAAVVVMMTGRKCGGGGRVKYC